MSITTKRGDSGMTDLLFGGKVSKVAPQVEALGEVDELNAVLGFARIVMDGEGAEAIDQVQKWLITLMGELAMPEGKNEAYDKAGFGRITESEITWVEDLAKKIEGQRQFGGWLRPGAVGGELAARLHLARTVTRRAERSTWKVSEKVATTEIRIFLNRLSDALWLMAQKSEGE